ncbi:MAG: sigma-70 family RNA polymerase sigma factor [Erysipelotrichaceae bacterium]|jgi:RNA polymerase sigma factor (sigma-70 family)|nr:sigma-70 family RNA polymerase sigma factor [Erysipelotrichaceae bacterium]
MNDQELVEAYHSNTDKDEIFMTVLNRHQGLLMSIVNKVRQNNTDYLIDRDDLYQEALIGLDMALNTYRQINKARFSTYAYHVIKNRVMAKAKEMSRIYGYEPVSYDRMEDKDRFLTEDKNERERIDKEVLNRYMKKLSLEDRTILKLYLLEYSYKEISVMTKTDLKRIDNRLFRIKKGLQSFIRDEIRL